MKRFWEVAETPRMTQTTYTRVLKALPVVQLLVGLAVGLGTAIASAAIYKASIDNTLTQLHDTDVSILASIKEQQDNIGKNKDSIATTREQLASINAKLDLILRQVMPEGGKR